MHKKKKIYLIGIIILVIIIAIIVVSRIRSSPELHGEEITEIEIILVQQYGVTRFKLSKEDSILACEKLNEMEKSFSGFAFGRKGWGVSMSCSNGQRLTICDEIITYNGIFHRCYKTKTNDMQNFMSWLETLNK